MKDILSAFNGLRNNFRFLCYSRVVSCFYKYQILCGQACQEFHPQGIPCCSYNYNNLNTSLSHLPLRSVVEAHKKDNVPMSLHIHGNFTSCVLHLFKNIKQVVKRFEGMMNLDYLQPIEALQLSQRLIIFSLI